MARVAQAVLRGFPSRVAEKGSCNRCRYLSKDTCFVGVLALDNLNSILKFEQNVAQVISAFAR